MELNLYSAIGLLFLIDKEIFQVRTSEEVADSTGILITELRFNRHQGMSRFKIYVV
jgi:hypothetical protein